MEDYIFAQHRNLDGYDLGLYAIFDGHSGHEVAKYLRSHLFENILSEVTFSNCYISVHTIIILTNICFLNHASKAWFLGKSSASY